MFTIDCVHLQGGRSWQPKNFRQARICFFRDKCVVLQSCKFSIICIISGWVSFKPLHQLHILHRGGVQQQLIIITGRRCLCSKGQHHQPQDHEVRARRPPLHRIEENSSASPGHVLVVWASAWRSLSQQEGFRDDGGEEVQKTQVDF